MSDRHILRNVECICGKSKGGLIKVPLSRIGYKSLEVHSVERGINGIYYAIFVSSFLSFVERFTCSLHG